MKNIFILILFYLLAISCKKEYTCACKFTTGLPSESYKLKAKKKDAKTWCKSWQTHYQSVGGECILE